MFIARNQKDEIVNSLEGCLEKDSFWCLACEKRVGLKKGKKRLHHFYHHALSLCPYSYERESEEHLMLKAKLYQSLVLTEEVHVEKICCQGRQIADIMVNRHLILEVQCSSLTIERLEQRSKTYRQHGYYVLWLLGEKLWLKDRLRELHKHFLYFSKCLGFYIWELDLKKDTLRLKYLITIDTFGICHYLKKEFPIDKNLLKYLRYPFSEKKIQQLDYYLRQDIRLFIQKQLYYGNQYWLRQQERAYLNGENLLNKQNSDFYPFLSFPKNDVGFCQIQDDLSNLYESFSRYYSSNKCCNKVTISSPFFYDYKS